MVETWRLLPHHSGATDLHFRLSNALARRAPEPTVWTHSGGAETIVIVAAQKMGELRIEDKHRISTVQRQSGGTAILTNANVLGVDVALTRGHPLAPNDILETYRWFGDTWVAALDHLGIPSRTVGVAEARSLKHDQSEMEAAVRAACFGTLSPWEVVAGSRKVVGLAQVRRQKNVLLQSGLHLSFDAESLARLLFPRMSGELAAELRNRATGLDELAERTITLPEVVDAFLWSLKRRHQVRLRGGWW